MADDISENIKQQSTWKRGLYMLMYALFYSVSEVVLFALVIVQFLLKLITGETNARLHKLGQSIATFIYQVIQYLTFNSEYQPYPFGAWPRGEPKIMEKDTLKDSKQDKK